MRGNPLPPARNGPGRIFTPQGDRGADHAFDRLIHIGAVSSPVTGQVNRRLSDIIGPPPDGLSQRAPFLSMPVLPSAVRGRDPKVNGSFKLIDQSTATTSNPQHLVFTMAFGKRDMRKSEEIQSRPLLRPGDASPARLENALDRPAKTNAIGVILPVLAGGIFVALISLWAVRHLAG